MTAVPLPSLDFVRRELARRELLDFVLYTMPDYRAGWFHREVCARLDRFLADVLARRSPRLMLFAPPRHGKSELASRRFPAFALGKAPDLSVIATSYAADLASRMNRDVQRIIDEEKYAALFPETRLFGKQAREKAEGSFLRNSDIFEIVGHRGVYRSAGVGGGITGMGSDVLVIDDPVKDAQEADSEVYRDRVYEWYTTTAYTRLAPGGGVLVIMTRWHEDDLAGRLLEDAKASGDKWDVVRFPAIAEADEENRKQGKALHPERYALEQLQKIKGAVGSRAWASLYQQRPAAAEGSIFKRQHWSWYRPTTADPVQLVRDLGITRVIQSWDTAHKKGQENDFSDCLTVGETKSKYLLLDNWKRKVEYPELKRSMQSQAAKWNPNVVLVEDSSAGQVALQELRRDTRLPLHAVTADRDKVSRANAVTPIHEAGLCSLPEGAAWVADFEDSLAAFPTGAHDDDVDAFTQAMNYIARDSGGFFAYAAQELERKEAAAQAAKAAREEK